MAKNVDLPKGFVLDNSTNDVNNQLPPGFILDSSISKEQPLSEVEQDLKKYRELGNIFKDSPVTKGAGLAAQEIGLGARQLKGLVLQEPQEGYNKELKDIQSQYEELPLSGKISNWVTKVVPFLGIGGPGVKGILLSGAAQSTLTPKDIESEPGISALGEKVIETGQDVAFDLGTYGALKGIGATKLLGSPFSSSKAKAKKYFTNQVLEEDAKPLSEIIKESEKLGVQTVDILDPRSQAFKTSVRNLQSAEARKIADKSLDEMVERTTKMQKSLLNRVAKGEVDSVEAAQIIGKNSKNIIDDQLAIRRAKSKPLYEKGLKGQVSLNKPIISDLTEEQANILGLPKGKSYTLNDFLKSSKAKELVNEAKQKSLEYSNTPGAFIYGNIHKQEVRPNSIKLLNSIDSILADKIGAVKLGGSSTEQAALTSVKKGLQKVLDDANPTLKKAREIYRNESEVLKELTNSEIGQLAKLYQDGKIDKLVDKSFNILNLKPKNIAKIRKNDPKIFQEAIKSSIQNKMPVIENASPNEINQRVREFKNFIFKKGNKEPIEAALGSKEATKGFKDTINLMEQLGKRAKITKEFTSPLKQDIEVPQSTFAVVSNSFNKAVEAIFFNDEVKKAYTDLLFTDEGKKVLKQIAKTEKSDKKIKLAIDLMTKAISIGETGKAASLASQAIFSNANAGEMTEQDILKARQEMQKQIPSSYNKEDLEQVDKTTLNRLYR